MPFLPWHPTAVWLMPAAPLELWPCQPLLTPTYVGLVQCQSLCICFSWPGSSCPVLHTPLQGHPLRHSPDHSVERASPSFSITICCFPFIKFPILICSYLNYLSICFWFVSPFLKGRSPSSGTGMLFTPFPSTGAGGQTIDMPVDVQWKATQR